MAIRPEDYTVGWVCAITTEYVVACEMLDEEYPKAKTPLVDTHRDSNIYTFGRIHEHNVVVACLPNSRYGTTSAAIVVERMRASFTALRFVLLVGIAGGAPSQKHDIRLGDVVVSSPSKRNIGVVQYDFGKAIEDHEFEITGHLAPPPDILLHAISNINMQHTRRGHRIMETISKMLEKNTRLQPQFSRPDTATDRLYETTSTSADQLVTRTPHDAQENCPAIYYGLIASTNQVMKDRRARDALIAKHEVLCFEMEAASLMNDFLCLITRGICDYSDPYKNDEWQGYAAAATAAYAKELLEAIPAQKTTQIAQAFDIPFTLNGIPLGFSCLGSSLHNSLSSQAVIGYSSM